MTEYVNSSMMSGSVVLTLKVENTGLIKSFAATEVSGPEFREVTIDSLSG